MRRIVLAGFAAALAGCAAQPGDTAAPASGGSAVLTAIGTPFLIAAKIPLCAVTIVAAGPLGATASLVPPQDPLGHEVRQGLADGIDQNCGPPWTVTP
ncbi:MAG TPA: hypothetical protein VLV50_18535 [Stellaceae bacterium]|nr:hypothetical protein [Stellaceae bacterium]